jgi:hypothetical protein
MRELQSTMFSWGFSRVDDVARCQTWTILIGCTHRTWVTLEVYIGKDNDWAMGKQLVTCTKCKAERGSNYTPLEHGEGRGELLLEIMRLGIRRRTYLVKRETDAIL